MGKGEDTRNAILERAAALASQMGLAGLSIGRLAEELTLSKSGLFAHFHSKEALQTQTVRFAAQVFVDSVIRPALKAPRGEPRVRALFERWIAWALKNPMKGGCFFVSAATELDDQDGPVREELVRQQLDWLELIANVARTGVTEGHFRRDLDLEQFAHDLNGIMLAYHHAARLLRDPRAQERSVRSFEALLGAARQPPKPPAAAGRPS